MGVYQNCSLKNLFSKKNFFFRVELKKCTPKYPSNLAYAHEKLYGDFINVLKNSTGLHI